MQEYTPKQSGETTQNELINLTDIQAEALRYSATAQSSWKDTMTLRLRVWFLLDLPRLLSYLPR